MLTASAFRGVATAFAVYFFLAFGVSSTRIVRSWWDASRASQHILDKNVHLQESIGALEAAIVASRKRQSEWLEQYSELGRVQRRVEEMVQQQTSHLPAMTSKEDPSTTESRSTLRLAQLLQITELSQFRSGGSLVKSVSAAIAELRKLADTAYIETSTSTSTLEDLLTATKDRAPIQVCQKALTSLQQHMDTVLKDLKRNGGTKEPSDAELQALIETRIAHHTAVAASAATVTATTTTTDDDDETNCFTNSTLAMEWVEAGLIAIDRGLDIRRVLERAIQTSGYTPPIFDAPLDPPLASPNARRLATQTTTTLRSILDTPTLHAMGRGVDWFLDTVVSGHSTSLDWALETYVYQDDENFLVGPWLVHQLLERTGDVNYDMSWLVL